MKKSISFHLLPVLVMLLCLSSCSETTKKTEYTHSIPSNVTEMASLDVKSIVSKAGLNDAASKATLQELLGALFENKNAALKEEAETLLQDPAESGIDWSAPVYLFKAPTLHSTAIALKIADLKKFEAMLELFAQEQLCTVPVKVQGYHSVEIKDAGVLIAYNDGTLLGVYGGSSEQLQKLQPAITALMQQPADKSIHANKHFTSMLQQKGDIRLLATPDALPMDVRGVLNWPHGTQLLGYVLFENGRIYATLQSADFKGDTKEDNQPFHPNNSRELQQAMLSMMHGRPFNISLTSDELLTLSNLRVLMEYASDEPEIKNLYQMIMKIEELNLRGDKNRTNFTIVLNEKKENALKQLVDFAKLFAGSNP